MKFHLIITATLFVAACCLPVASCNSDHVEENLVEDEIVVPEVVVKNAIIEMQLADWCSPCKRLKASGAIQELEKQGWTIVYTGGIAKKYPSFRVWVNGKSKVFTGYSSKSSFFTRIKNIVKDLKD